ncbi:MAG: AAA family ATPase [Nostocaceae cyanobacterium]|nr:AAA family ATPase [Nostocaceae cyanobacterium]
MAKITTIGQRHWKALLAWNAFIILAAMGAASRYPSVYTAKTQLIMPGTGGNLNANLGVLGSLRNGSPNFYSSQFNALKLQLSFLSSDTLMRQAWEKDPEKSEFTSLSQYKSLFSIALDEETSIISVYITGSTQEVAQARANALLEAYQKRLRELRQNNKTTRQQFSQSELETAKKKLQKLQLALTNFKQSTGLVDAELQTQGIVQSINQLSNAQAEALAQAEYSQKQVIALSNRLNMAPPEAINSLSLGENQDYQFVRGKLAELEADLLKKRNIYTDEHPSVQMLLQEREQLLRKQQNYVAQASGGNKIDTTVNGQGRGSLIQRLVLAESEASAQRQRAQQIQTQLNNLRTKLKSIPSQRAKLIELQQQVEIAEGVYKGFVAQVQQTNIDAFDAYPNVQVFEPPTVGSRPRNPKLMLVILNALLAAVIGSIASVLLLERRNPLLSPKDLQRFKFPMVVSIPQIRNSLMRWQFANDTELEFQRLASAISLQPLNNRRLLISSAIEGEGKTTVTLGLATALVELGFRVLVVDADFRQQELSRCLNSCLLKGNDLPMRIQQNLDFLAMPTLSYQGNTLEMVKRGRFEMALAAAESDADYDYVLIDSAPISLTSETLLMSAIVPNVLFVVRPGTSYSSSVNYSLEQLTTHKAEVVGLVVNGGETPTRPYQQKSQDPLFT